MCLHTFCPGGLVCRDGSFICEGFFPFGYDDAGDRMAGHVDTGSRHVHDAVDTGNDGDAFRGETDGICCRQKHDE